MHRKCCIPGCNSSSKRNIVMHKMPAAREKVMLWHKTMSAAPFNIFEGMIWGEIGKLFVCHKHFEAKYISSKGILKPNACPTLFTPEEITSGTPANTSGETGSIELRSLGKQDHSYARKCHHDHTYAMSKSVDHTISGSSQNRAAADSVVTPLESMPFRRADVRSSIEPNAAGASSVPPGDQVSISVPPADQASVSVAEPSIEPAPANPVVTPLESMPFRRADARSSIEPNAAGASSVPPGDQVSISVPPADQASVSVAEPSIEPAPANPDPTLVPGKLAQNTRPEMQRTSKWVCRKRLVSNVGQLSPKCRELYQHYQKANKQRNYFKRAKMASKLSKKASFKQLVTGMNSVARKFIWMQIKLYTKSKKGRRFTLEEKVIALSIMKQSPKCYRFLQRIFILPSKTTLNKLLVNLNIEAGINPQVFNVIKQEVSKWNEAKKMCSIIFDEMKLEPGVHYSKKHDNIKGFVELSEKTNHFADHALAFIIKGAVHKWHQPCAFYFSEGAASGPQMKVIIKAIVAAVCETGLQPIALISDQGTSFQSAFKSLQEDTRRSQILAGAEPDDTIHLNGQCLSVVYDPPHLIKGIRNNFLTKDVVMEGKTSKWQDLVDVYRTDCRHAQARLLHKLNDEHILPEKIKKMKVKNCVRVFSKTMAAALSYTASFSRYADGRPVSATLANTAELVTFLDDLFDSVNGASTHHKHTRGKKLRTAVTEDSEHHAFWTKAISVIENIQFIDRNGKLVSVPSLKNWVTTLKSHQRLWQVLKNKNIKIMRPRYFNSDAIENFFGRVRSYNARNNDPTCHAFECTFKALLITNLINFHESSYNCEQDFAEQIIKIQALFSDEDMNTNEDNLNARSVDSVPSASSSRTDRDEGAEQLWLEASRERLHVHSRAYTAGWVTRKVLKTLVCNECKQHLTSEETAIHKWISQREYNVIIKNKLTYPSVHAVRAFGDIVKESNEYLEHNAHKTKIKRQLNENLMSKYSFDFLKCKTHRDVARQLFISVSVTLCIFNWCNTINKILKGTDISRLDMKNVCLMQAQAYQKYRKSLKNKSLNK